MPAADLIVVGNRGINTRLGRILGSVPSVVSQRSPCDVLIVHTVEGGTGD
jgi:nucleotide-binding universal stress UspA family protein